MSWQLNMGAPELKAQAATAQAKALWKPHILCELGTELDL